MICLPYDKQGYCNRVLDFFPVKNFVQRSSKFCRNGNIQDMFIFLKFQKTTCFQVVSRCSPFPGLIKKKFSKKMLNYNFFGLVVFDLVSAGF